MDSSPANVSFIGIVDFSQEARWIHMTESVTELLGYEPSDLIGRPSLELVHPDEFSRVKLLHYDTISQDKAAVLVYLRMRHKDPYKGFILCGISRTVVHNVLVGSVSFASPAKALHNASTAQEITVITPSAANFEFRRWNDPSPMPPSPVQRHIPLPSPPSPAVSSASSYGSTYSRASRSPSSPKSPRHRSQSRSPSPSPSPPHEAGADEPITFDHLPSQSFRTAFILDRFSVNCTINYCSNDLLISTTSCTGRSFFDFVSKKDEEIVRSWIDCVKGWGVNERGQPSDGGFGFGRFSLLTEGRDSISRIPEPPPSRHRHGSQATSRSRNARSNVVRPVPHANRPRLSPSDPGTPKITVDAIFSAHSDGLMVILRRAPMP